jgi:hypothetical protein
MREQKIPGVSLGVMRDGPASLMPYFRNIYFATGVSRNARSWPLRKP